MNAGSSSRLIPYLFLLPALALLTFFVLMPMAQVVWYSFLRYSFFSPHQFIGLENFRRMWADDTFWWTLLNSLLYVLVTPVLMVVSLLLALGVRRIAQRASAVRLVYFLPVITPVIVVGIMWRWIFTEETGLLNYCLTLLGLPKVAWLTQYPMNMVSVMILTVWRGFGYYLMMFLSGLALIPTEIEEASRLDGTTPLQHVWHILLPSLKPTILFIAVMSSTSAIRLFTELYVLIPGAPMDNKTLVAYMYRQAFERFDFGYGSALALVLFLLTLGLSYLNVRLMERS